MHLSFQLIKEVLHQVRAGIVVKWLLMRNRLKKGFLPREKLTSVNCDKFKNFIDLENMNQIN